MTRIVEPTRPALDLRCVLRYVLTEEEGRFMQLEPVRLGLMPPLTGVVGMYGAEISIAAQIACREVNARGGIEDGGRVCGERLRGSEEA